MKDVNEVDALILGGRELNNNVPEYLKVHFPRLSLGLGRWISFLLLVLYEATVSNEIFTKIFWNQVMQTLED